MADRLKNEAEGTGKVAINREFRTATQADRELIDQLRSKYTAGKTRNVAAAKGKIGDDIIDLESVSGKFTDKDHFNKGNFKPPQPDEYKYQGPIPEYTNHTEQKIVEYLRNKYKDNPNIKGQIEIISERPYCDNCIDLVGQFQSDFPNITVIRVEVSPKGGK
ncbi:deaminase domain-containing protein [Paenibacillus algorifonticola]|uniref:deaminase domain-containing protein n=1 Tax=Paenibacillus algorifonticola TaxID=684063 RepID=UPI003D284B3D